MWRGRSPNNVVDELEYLVKKYKANGFYIQDDSVSVDVGRLKSICKLIIKKKLDLKWTTPNGIAHWTLDEEALDLMKKAGCYRITFGIESGNIEIRKWVGKPYDLKQATKLTKYANKIGMWTLSTNIIGFPYESREQIEDTVNYAISSDVDFALFFRLSPRPGTKVYEVFKKEGWLPKNKKYLLSEDIACQTKFFKPGKLLEIQNYAYKKFLLARLKDFLNPVRLIRKIKNFEDFLYVTILGYHGVKMAFSLIKTKTGITSKVYRS
ncbi:MAG: (Dimethylallyl)adenosine tRNA methylthiotransferase MiaB [Candidatus Dependentiae bacterium ADurb.Bin246]|nr:MAG: (Dimethylallyl)adenosine tRNA methylthiotransferase MiaB [Candidatus Dependentiae bacterium ADurb.Bin246]